MNMNMKMNLKKWNENQMWSAMESDLQFYWFICSFVYLVGLNM